MSREDEELPPTAESLQTAEEDNPGDAHLSQTLLRPKQAATPRRSGLTSRSTSCAACHTANTSHVAHTYTGDCRYLPGRSIHGNAQSREEPTRDSGIQSGTAPTDLAEPPGLDSSQTLYPTQSLITPGQERESAEGLRPAGHTERHRGPPGAPLLSVRNPTPVLSEAEDYLQKFATMHMTRVELQAELLRLARVTL